MKTNSKQINQKSKRSLKPKTNIFKDYLQFKLHLEKTRMTTKPFIYLSSKIIDKLSTRL